jgi:hypothetical protein
LAPSNRSDRPTRRYDEWDSSCETDNKYLGVVVLPDAARDLVTAEVEGLELDLSDAELLRRRVLRRLVLHQPLRRKKGKGHARVRKKRRRDEMGRGDDPICVVGSGKWRVGSGTSSLSMWRSVVLPALSRPRKRILASFCHSPSEASTP